MRLDVGPLVVIARDNGDSRQQREEKNEHGKFVEIHNCGHL
jgi:hypothetical protein